MIIDDLEAFESDNEPEIENAKKDDNNKKSDSEMSIDP